MPIQSTLNEKNKHRVRVGRSYAGHGLFAREAFKKGERIIEYVGLKITNKEVEAIPGDNRYLLEIGNRYTIDGRPRFNIARYANHACRPNAEAETIRGRVFLTAKKAIAADDEITWDYGKEYFKEFITKEKCRCPACAERRAAKTA